MFQIYHDDCRPYNCTMCDRGFLDRYKLTRHERIHSGIRPPTKPRKPSNRAPGEHFFVNGMHPCWIHSNTILLEQYFIWVLHVLISIKRVLPLLCNDVSAPALCHGAAAISQC